MKRSIRAIEESVLEAIPVQIDERVPVQEIIDLTRVYERVIEGYLERV